MDVLDSPVSAIQPSVIITEQGTAELFGNSQNEQVRQLIENTAHPEARDHLWRRAREFGLA